MTPARLGLLIFCLAILVTLSAIADPAVSKRVAPVPNHHTPFAHLELASSFLPAIGEADATSISASYSARFGYRTPRHIDFFCVLEHDVWIGSDLAFSGLPHVLNWGGGMGVILRHAKVRSSLAAGGSTMLFDGVNAEAGTTGMFVDVRPLALRFMTGHNNVLEVVLLSFQASMPKIEGIPIIHLEFRSALTLELGSI